MLRRGLRSGRRDRNETAISVEVALGAMRAGRPQSRATALRREDDGWGRAY